jgi:hypothetical protein
MLKNIHENTERVLRIYLKVVHKKKYKISYLCRFVQAKSLLAKEVVQRFKVPTDKDTLLLFNENTERPVASLSMPDIPIKTMHDIIGNNKYLLLPRLSSQVIAYSIKCSGFY